MMIDVFRVGVHIGMTTNATQVLSAMLKELAGVHIAAGKLEKGLGNIGNAALAAGAVFVGWEVTKGIFNAIEHNRELNKELEKTKQLGGDFAKNIDSGATLRQAVRTQNEVPTTTYSGNVRLLREVGMTLGHPDAANDLASEAAKAAYVISHATGEDQEEITKNLMRTADARGHIFKTGADGKEHVDATLLHEELQAAVQGLILGQGFIKSSDLLQMAKMAGIAGRGQDAGVFYSTGTENAIMLGASKTGVAETGLMQQFIGGTMTKKVAEHLQEAGLLHEGDWHSGKSGGVVVNSNVAQRMSGVMSDPQAYFSTGPGAQAIKEYADKNHISNMMAILQLFGKQTTQRLAADFMGNAPQFDRAREIFGGIPDIDKQYKELQSNDLDTNMIAISAAWKSFMEAFSNAGVPLIIPILNGLTSAIQSMATGMATHPDIGATLIALAGGISSLVALSGAMKIFGIVVGPFVDGIKLLCGIQGLTAAGPGLTSLAGGASSVASVVGLAGLGTLLTALAAGLSALALGAYGLPRGFEGLSKEIDKSLPDWLRTKKNIQRNGANDTTGGSSDTPTPGNGGPINHGGRGSNSSGHGHETIAPAPGQQGSLDTPVLVHVANAGDIGRGVAGGFANGVNRPSSGPSYTDYRIGLPAPGLGSIG